MELWHLWTAALAGAIHSLATAFGGSDALAIITLTLGARLALAPVSFTAARRQDARRVRLEALRPEIDALKARHADDPAALSAATMALYRERGVTFVDRLALASVATQATFGLGIWQALRASTFASRFLWIPSLARPDALLTLLVGLLMVAAMAAAPGATGQAAAQAAMAVAVLLAVVTLWSMPSAVGVYWAASNVATLAQALALRALAARRGRSTARP